MVQSCFVSLTDICAYRSKWFQIIFPAMDERPNTTIDDWIESDLAVCRKKKKSTHNSHTHTHT